MSASNKWLNGPQFLWEKEVWPRKPFILPYRHHVTDLIIAQHHQNTGHLGQEYVLSSLRQLYWIIKSRSAVRRVISGCFPCKKSSAVRGGQLMADLPN